MKKINNLEDVGELLKEKKPKKETNTLEATKPQVTKSKIIQIHRGLKMFR